MISLIIETSTEKGCVAITDKVNVIFEGNLPSGLNNSKFLLPEIEKGFQSLNISPKDLNYIVVGIGPGSYTGIRVGVMAAKTLAYALKIPLIGICTLECFVPKDEGVFASLIDAKIGGAYCLKGIKTKEAVEYITKPEVRPIANLGDFLKDVKTIVTPQSMQIRQKIENLYPESSWGWEEAGPSVLQMALLGLKKFENMEYSKDGQIEILYLRKTQAELERESKS